jgi:hypothetical protein
MTRLAGIAACAALLALAQGCSDDDKRANPPSTCTATPQTAPDPAGAEAYCAEFLSATCDRSFGDCPAIGLGEIFATVEECRASMTAGCGMQTFSNDWYDAPCGAVCVGYLRGADCGSLVMGDEPQACAVATGSFAPEPLSTITAGTFTDTITAGDPIYDGGHARSYAIHFTAGQSVTIETSAPSVGTPIPDTYLHLIGPSGTPLAEDDDGGLSLYSRIATIIPATGDHLVIVRGFSSSLVGSYDLTITAP